MMRAKTSHPCKAHIAKQCCTDAAFVRGTAPTQQLRSTRRSGVERQPCSVRAALATEEPKLQRPDASGRFGKYGGKCARTLPLLVFFLDLCVVNNRPHKHCGDQLGLLLLCN